MTVPDFVLCALFTAYFAHVIPHTAGFRGMFIWLRKHDPTAYTDADGTVHKVTECPFCLAPYLAAIAYGLLFTPASFLVTVFAIAGAALMASAFTGLRHL